LPMAFDIVDLSQLTAPGLVLDVGGGGEGIIGSVLGRQVIAIRSPPGRAKGDIE